VFIEELSIPSIKPPGEITPEPPEPKSQIMVIDTSIPWMQAFIDYIKKTNYPKTKQKRPGLSEEARTTC
jgi:hypothetical protein